MKDIRILHIIDDIKFLESCKLTFDLRIINNFYLNSKEINLEYLVKNKIDILVIHYLRIPVVKFLNQNTLTIPVVWFFWGADGFRLGKFYNKFLLPHTKRIKLRLAFRKSINSGMKEVIKRSFINFLDLQSLNRGIIKSFSKIDVIIPVVPEDFDILKSHYNISSKVFHLNYALPIFNNEYDYQIDENILLGNSADYSNNHIEVIDVLSNLDLGKGKVIIPLSYGNKQYGNYIDQYAKKKLQNKVKCLLEFLPFDQYQEIVQSCGIVIMNHVRQQAVGNIIQSLMLGSRIYLNPESVVFHFLDQKGFIVSNNMELNNLRLLSHEEQLHNRNLCRQVFGKELQNERVMDLIENLYY